MRQLTELEGVCLGMISRLGQCTAYRVRRQLAASPSTHWQASAGSVYPLLSRLEEDGLLFATEDKEDGRGRRLLRPSAKGKRALRNWIRAGADPRQVAAVMDPVRSRIFYLDTLDAAEQRRFLDDVVDELQAFLDIAREELDLRPADEDLCEHLGAQGAMLLTAARLDWLKAVRKRLERSD